MSKTMTSLELGNIGETIEKIHSLVDAKNYKEIVLLIVNAYYDGREDERKGEQL